MNKPETHIVPIRHEELLVDRAFLRRVLGYADVPVPEPVQTFVDEALAHAPSLLEAQGAFTILPAGSATFTPQTISCPGIEFHTEPIISSRLRRSLSLALFICTIGPRLEEWARSLMDGGDMLEGFIVDQIGSELVERATDRLETHLIGHVAGRGWKTTSRYSPGYCDWSVAEQHKLFTFFPQGTCGIRLTESALMVPIKSVSGIIGLGPEVKKEEYDCRICDLEDCFRRRVH